MTTPLTKLIEENKWRPIAEATANDLKRQLLVRLPRNNGKYGVTTAIYIGKHEMRAEDWNWENEDYIDRDEENDVDYVPEGWFEQIESDCSDYGWFGLNKSNYPTHFRPLPDDRLARVTEVLLEALKEIEEYSIDGDSKFVAESARNKAATIAEDASQSKIDSDQLNPAKKV